MHLSLPSSIQWWIIGVHQYQHPYHPKSARLRHPRHLASRLPCYSKAIRRLYLSIFGRHGAVCAVSPVAMSKPSAKPTPCRPSPSNQVQPMKRISLWEITAMILQWCMIWMGGFLMLGKGKWHHHLSLSKTGKSFSDLPVSHPYGRYTLGYGGRRFERLIYSSKLPLAEAPIIIP